MYKLLIPLVLILCLGFSACKKSGAPTAPATGSCAGVVLNEAGKPIAEATITTTADRSILVKTDVNGKYLLDKIPTGKVFMNAEAIDYTSQTQTVDINGGAVTQLNFTLKNGPNRLSVSLNSMPLLPKALNFDFNISSNAAWTISTPPDWITFSQMNGEGNAIVTMKVTENNTDNIRDGIFNFSSSSVSGGTVLKDVVLRQAAPVKLISPANNLPVFKDSIALTFNQPVKLLQFTDKASASCHGDNGFRYYEDNKVVKIRYGCGIKGNAYPLSVTVADMLGFETTVNFTAQF